MERTVTTARSHANLDSIIARGIHVDGVLEIFVRIDPTDVVSAAGITGGFDINTIGSTVYGTVIGHIGIIVSHALTTDVKILGLNDAGNGTSGATERSLANLRRLDRNLDHIQTANQADANENAEVRA